MSHTIEVRLTRPTAVVLADVRRLLESNGVDCVVTQDGGSFSGRGFAGDFRVVGGLATIDVRDKPALLPWSLVEAQIRSFFGS